MTTTAEKIAEKIAELEASARALRVNLKIHQDRVEKLKASIKPADLEPLECWVAVVTVKAHRHILRFSQNHKTAIEDISKRESLVHMREVTPQDKLDR